MELARAYAEYIGNAGGLIVLVSLLMRSLVRLRWINLLGAIIFCFYGMLVEAPAIVLTNLGIAGIDIWYLWKMHTELRDFRLVKAEKSSGYFLHFWETNRGEIEQFFGKVEIRDTDWMVYMLRSNQIAGLLVGRQTGNTMHITIDYVTPEYRDFRLGKHFFEEDTSDFKALGVQRLTTSVHSEEFGRYIGRLKFQKLPGQENLYYKDL